MSDDATLPPLPRRAAHELIDLFPSGVILVSPTGRVRAANRRAEHILQRGDGLTLDGAQLCTSDPEQTEQLRALVRALAQGGPAESRNGGAAPVSRPSGRRPLQVVASRLGNGSGSASIALFVSDPDETVEIPAERLRRLYGLTPSEARIATRLASGLRPEQVARDLGVQTNTIRMHLKRIFAKTRTGRQSELVGLLLRGAARL